MVGCVAVSAGSAMWSMMAWGRVALVAACALAAASPSSVRAQEPAGAGGEPGTREKQAAAEAYDKGSTAYLAGDYPTAAQWFETAHRMAPNSAALLQATRAYEHAENAPRAATLALQIVQQYSEDAEAVAYAQGLLDELAPSLVRIDVSCDGCRLELEGKLIEQTSFFIEAGKKQKLVAEFNTGRRVGTVHGDPGTTRLIELEAPAEGAAPAPVVDLGPPEARPAEEPKPVEEPEDRPRKKDDGDGKPFGPLVTWIGVGVTGVGLALSVLSTIDTTGGVSDYEAAAKAARECTAADCSMLDAKAKSLLEDGQSKEGRTTILWIATGGAAAITGTIALFLTDWSGDDGNGDKAELRWDVRPLAGGAVGTLSGRF